MQSEGYFPYVREEVLIRASRNTAAAPHRVFLISMRCRLSPDELLISSSSSHTRRMYKFAQIRQENLYVTSQQAGCSLKYINIWPWFPHFSSTQQTKC